ncbi:transcriptional activator [Vulcanimicrobium alpinum]|uniref:Transcriptional activator n=1 Tax=Vulcanimicrobium alpinum TaxID=3016050 RepID=A0AAN2CBA1_UNVUL|nr:AAA family ATPase [Vulcanimicrobium alpinum]BDE07768.1 transcriptional activator [Vulcanimicrobium alpinum]
MLRVHLFGHPRLLLDEIAFPTASRPKVIPLLAYVLLHDGPLARRAVAGTFWPDAAEDDARANLRRHLNYLQRLLPQAPPERPWILAGERTIQWNPAAPVWCDVRAFEQLAADPRRARDALALYAGDLLADVGEPWVDAERERLRERYLDAADVHVAALRAAGDDRAAIAAAQRVLALDPWREDTLRVALQLRHACGDRSGALAQYDAFAQRLRRELGAAPMPETRAVHAAILRDAAPAEPRSAPGARASPLPASLPFAGRDAELTVLREAYDAAAAGHGGLVLVGGEAGVGKTRLVREFAARCEARGAQVFSASLASAEAEPYHGPALLLQRAATLAQMLGVDPLALRVLAAIAPALDETALAQSPLEALDPARERARLFDAFAGVWIALARRRPAIVLLDDAQWAGDATLALFEHLAHRAAGERVLVVMTYREDELAPRHPLRALRRSGERDGICRHLALARLSRDAIGALVGWLGDASAAATFAAELYERSEGNAFFAGELIRGAIESGRLHEADGDWHVVADRPGDALPPALRDVLAQRIARLDDASRTLAEFAAVIGRDFDVELLRETSGWSEASVLDALESLVDRRVVAIVGMHGRFDYAFTHQLMQGFVYEAIDPAVRRHRHRRIAHVMEAGGARRRGIAAASARHWDCGGDAERAAARYVDAACEAFEVYAYTEASAAVDRVLALGAADRTRFDALLVRERIAAIAGERERQASALAELTALARLLGGESVALALERTAEHANVVSDRRRERVAVALLERFARRSRDPHWRSRALALRARQRRWAEDFDGAHAAFAELIAFSAQSDHRRELVRARLAVAYAFIYEGKLERANDALASLRAEAHATGNASDLIRTLMTFARAALARQDYAAMTECAEEARDLSRAIGDTEGEALALHTIANGLVYAFRIDGTSAHYREALALYERLAHRVGIASIAVDMGLFATELGLFDEALARYARAREVAAAIGFRWVTCIERIDAGYCARLQGDDAGAEAAGEEALRLARDLGSAPLESAALATVGAARSARGRHAEALAFLHDAVALRRPAGPTPRLGDNLCALARALLRANLVDDAARVAAELRALYDAHLHLPPQPAERLVTIARAERAAGRDGAAETALRRARAAMQARAAAIRDPAIRSAFLALPFHREATATAALRTPG